MAYDPKAIVTDGFLTTATGYDVTYIATWGFLDAAEEVTGGGLLKKLIIGFVGRFRKRRR